MMLRHNVPPATNFSQARGQSKFQFFALAVRAEARTPSNGRRERYVFPRSNLHVSKVKPIGFANQDKNFSQVAM